MRQPESLKAAVERLAAATAPDPDAGFLGADPAPEECRVVMIQVPWDATVSYRDGTAAGPEAIRRASHQLDLEDGRFDQPFRAGISMPAAPAIIGELAPAARRDALAVIGHDDPDGSRLAAVNSASSRVNDAVLTEARRWGQDGRIVAVVGGDHSSPYGLLRHLGERHPDGFGILHIDAHLDLRAAYEGFVHSHASIMYNVMRTVPAARSLVQVGIRDFSREETRVAAALGPASRVFQAGGLFRRLAAGESWQRITADILSTLPPKVYVSFDIDGLDPACCPSTGTPVPGGLSFDQGMYLVEELATSGRRIIGFDLCEVAPGPDDDEWDANVGARVLYKLCGAAIHSNGWCGASGRSG